MKIIRVVYFTENGKRIKEKLDSSFIMEEKPCDIDLKSWTRECFELHLPILFISSTGIAVRTIGPFLDNKLKDSPVIVVDELGKNVIPILSGHFGGANELSLEIASALNANPVITTATDINNVFAVDIFAKKNGLRISDKSKIKEVSAKALRGEPLDIKESEDVIIVEGLKLIPKRLILGIGCKKGKTFQELHSFVNQFYSDEELEEKLYAIASIDVKEGEIGLIKLAQYYGVFFLTYSADELKAVEGDYDESDFVNSQVGVGNVCERAAMVSAMPKPRLIKNKIAENGMTLAAATRDKINIVW